MHITITKGEHRNTLTCTRIDGSVTSANLGPDLPYHDLAHLVVESEFNLRDGFFGKIKSGMTINQLSNKEVIKVLGPEAWLAEIMTRNLQALMGTTTNQEYIELVQWEAQNMKITSLPDLSLSAVAHIKSTYIALCEQWDSLKALQRLQLEF